MLPSSDSVSAAAHGSLNRIMAPNIRLKAPRIVEKKALEDCDVAAVGPDLNPTEHL